MKRKTNTLDAEYKRVLRLARHEGLGCVRMNILDIARETTADDRAHVAALVAAADGRFVAGLHRGEPYVPKHRALVAVDGGAL